MGTQLLLPQKGAEPPKFSAHICCRQIAAWIKMPLGREVGLSPSDIVLDEDPAPPTPKGGGATQFSAHICCGQMAGRVKVPLGREVGLSPSNIVLDGDWGPSFTSPKRGQSPPIFGPCLLWPNGWMDQDATWYGSRPPPMPYVMLDGDPAPLPLRESGTTAPLFSAHIYYGHGRTSQLLLSSCI